MNTNDGVIGHNINNCDALKGKIFNPIKSSLITFEKEVKMPQV